MSSIPTINNHNNNNMQTSTNREGNQSEATPSHARYCHIVKRPDFDGYGFNLHSEKMKPGQFIGKVDENSPAELAGLKEGDRIIEVNGVPIGTETHKQVVQRIKAIACEVRLLLIDPKLEKSDATDGSNDVRSNGNINNNNNNNNNSKNNKVNSNSNSNESWQSKLPEDEDKLQNNSNGIAATMSSSSSSLSLSTLQPSSSSSSTPPPPPPPPPPPLSSSSVNSVDTSAITKSGNIQQFAGASSNISTISMVSVKRQSNANTSGTTNTNANIQNHSMDTTTTTTTTTAMDNNVESQNNDNSNNFRKNGKLVTNNENDEMTKSSLPPPLPPMMTSVSATGSNSINNSSNSNSNATTKMVSTLSGGGGGGGGAGGLNLPLTAAEMRAKLMAKKKFDPKNDSLDLKKKFEIIQKL